MLSLPSVSLSPLEFQQSLASPPVPPCPSSPSASVSWIPLTSHLAAGPLHTPYGPLHMPHAALNTTLPHHSYPPCSASFLFSASYVSFLLHRSPPWPSLRGHGISFMPPPPVSLLFSLQNGTIVVPTSSGCYSNLKGFFVQLLEPLNLVVPHTHQLTSV